MTKITSKHKKARTEVGLVTARPFQFWQDHKHNEEARIEIVPLIDVIFCILTFFILAAVNFSRQQAISLDLPKAKTGTSQMQDMMIVSLDDLGQIYVEKQPLSTNAQLAQLLKTYINANPNGLMVLNASKNASYKDVIQVLDVLREVGGNRVALATLPGDSNLSNNQNDLSGNGNLFPYGTQIPSNALNPLTPNQNPLLPSQNQPLNLNQPSANPQPNQFNVPVAPSGNSTQNNKVIQNKDQLRLP
jgi:biopolymer transport protein ExbD